MGIFLREPLGWFCWNILRPINQPPHDRMSADVRGFSGITKPSVLLGGGAPPPGWRAEVPGPFPTPRSHPFSAPHRWLWCRGAMALRSCRGPRFPPIPGAVLENKERPIGYQVKNMILFRPFIGNAVGCVIHPKVHIDGAIGELHHLIDHNVFLG